MTSIPKKTVTFGELLLRLGAPALERLFQSPALQATFGGGEANVAVSLAHFGLDSHFVSRLPANAVGDAAVRALRAEGVAVDGVQRGGHRVGIYYSETGASHGPRWSSTTALTPPSASWTRRRSRGTTRSRARPGSTRRASPPRSASARSSALARRSPPHGASAPSRAST